MREDDHVEPAVDAEEGPEREERDADDEVGDQHGRDQEPDERSLKAEVKRTMAYAVRIASTIVIAVVTPAMRRLFFAAARTVSFRTGGPTSRG